MVKILGVTLTKCPTFSLRCGKIKENVGNLRYDLRFFECKLATVAVYQKLHLCADICTPFRRCCRLEINDTLFGLQATCNVESFE